MKQVKKQSQERPAVDEVMEYVVFQRFTNV